MNCELHNLREKLGLVGELIDGWETRGANELERDLALELLREVYSEMKFSESEPAAKGVPLLRGDGSEADGVVAADECVQAAPLPDTTIIDETVLEGEDCLMPEPEPEPKPEHEPAITPRRVDPKVIRSLYGTDDEESEAVACIIPEAEAVPPAAPPLHEETIAQAPPLSPHTTTLGDSLNAGQKTLGESLREGNGERDMASHIAAAERPDLKKSIGLNDRFLMIRDLFDGNAAAFDEAITRLDAFPDLDSAVIYIHDTYDWNADSEGAKRLVELLERKLA